MEPADSQECKEFVVEAFRMSEEFDTPVMVRLTTRVAHGQSLVEPGERQEPALPAYVKNAPKYVMLPAHGRKRHLVVEARRKKLEEYSETTSLNRIEWGDKRWGSLPVGQLTSM